MLIETRNSGHDAGSMDGIVSQYSSCRCPFVLMSFRYQNVLFVVMSHPSELLKILVVCHEFLSTQAQFGTLNIFKVKGKLWWFIKICRICVFWEVFVGYHELTGDWRCCRCQIIAGHFGMCYQYDYFPRRTYICPCTTCMPLDEILWCQAGVALESQSRKSASAQTWKFCQVPILALGSY